MTSQPSRRGAPEAPDPLPIPVVDNHTHLDISRDGEEVTLDDLGPVLSAAAAVGVDRVVQVGCDLPGARFAVAAAERYPGVLAGVALHPNEAPGLAAAGQLDAALAEIERLAAHPRVRVVGETGLDYFRTGDEGRPAQQESFRRHIDLAKRLDRALQIHDRDSHDDVLAILAEEGAPERTVLHCFSGGPEMARECVDRGYSLSFAGTVTFKVGEGAARRPRRDPPRPAPRRDRRPLPHSAPLARRDEPPGPGPPDRARDGGGPRGGGADALRGPQRQRGTALRSLGGRRDGVVTQVSPTGVAGGEEGANEVRKEAPRLYQNLTFQQGLLHAGRNGRGRIASDDTRDHASATAAGCRRARAGAPSRGGWPPHRLTSGHRCPESTNSGA